jgi:hypothetical protein
MVGSDPPPGGTGSNMMGSNATGSDSTSCSLDSQTAAQTFNAVMAQECNVAGSQGAKHWYRGFGQLPGDMEYVQLELWDGKGAFTGTTAAPGTYTISGSDASFDTCGVCVRALGGKGGTSPTEYFATGGTVDVTAVGSASFAATLSDLSFVEVDPTSHAVVPSGCTANLAMVGLSGSVTVLAGGGGGGGGGGCPATIGDL